MSTPIQRATTLAAIQQAILGLAEAARTYTDAEAMHVTHTWKKP